MHHLLGPANLGLAAFGMNLKRHVLDRAECRWYVVEGSNTQYVPVVQVQYSELGPAEPGRIRQHGVEDGLQVAHRVGNDLQHLGGRGLLLQRLAKIARPRLHLVEQPHVLNRDHRLVGKGAGEFDLSVGERPHPGAPNHDDADDGVLPQHRDGEDGAMHLFLAPQIFGPSILRVRENIVNVYDAAVQDSPSRG